MSPHPDPWRLGHATPWREPLLAAFWRHRHQILERWPHLPLPTYAPGTMPLRYLPGGEYILSGHMMYVNDRPGGDGPTVHAGALIRLWHRWPWVNGFCHVCPGPMVGVYWGGFPELGGALGVCVECFTRGSRRLPGLREQALDVIGVLEGSDLHLDWQPYAFRLGGRAPELLDVLHRLGERDLDSDLLVPHRDTSGARRV